MHFESPGSIGQRLQLSLYDILNVPEERIVAALPFSHWATRPPQHQIQQIWHELPSINDKIHQIILVARCA